MKRFTIKTKLIVGIATVLLLTLTLILATKLLEKRMMTEHQYLDNYLKDIDSLNKSRESHLNWFSNLEYALQTNDYPNVELDYKECEFGKWYHTYVESERFQSALPNYKQIILDMEEYHRELHISAKALIEERKKGKNEEIILQYEELAIRYSNALLELMNKADLKLLDSATTSIDVADKLMKDSEKALNLSILLAFIISVAISGYLIKSIALPLSKFINRVRKMNKNEMYKTVDDIHTKDEIAELIVVFNKMVNKVNDQQLELQEQNEELIAQREELTAQNEEFLQQQNELQDILIKLTNQEDRLNRLYSFSQMLNQTIDLKELINNALSGLLNEVSAQVGAFMLYDNLNEELITKVSLGIVNEENFSSLKLGCGLAGRAAAQRKALVANYGDGELHSEGLYGKISMVSEIYLPLIIQGRLLGVAVVGRLDTKPFDDNEKKFLTALCDQVVVALDNALTHLETQKALDQVQELDKLKSEMISTVSHELRTPLASILGFSELLLAKQLDSNKSKKFLTTIYNESKRLKNLINDFLDLQKIENGKLEYVKKQVDLVQLLKSSMEIYQSQNQHSLNLNVEGDLQLIHTDPDRIQQVMGNLLSNAIKYSPQGGKIEVIVSKNSYDQVEISVKDEGLGIPKEAQSNLFQPFFRVDNSDRREIGGTGLGLAICQRIVQALGGDIWVKSVHGKGSNFTFTLPI